MGLESVMRALIVAAGLAVAVAGCARAPVNDPPTISYDGHFGGTVVADRVTPVSTRYQNLCEGRAGKWRYGAYRPYGDCASVNPTVRARY
jgi:hypothetical protein